LENAAAASSSLTFIAFVVRIFSRSGGLSLHHNQRAESRQFFPIFSSFMFEEKKQHILGSAGCFGIPAA
jgi:hypothetical protein